MNQSTSNTVKLADKSTVSKPRIAPGGAKTIQSLKNNSQKQYYTKFSQRKNENKEKYDTNPDKLLGELNDLVGDVEYSLKKNSIGSKKLDRAQADVEVTKPTFYSDYQYSNNINDAVYDDSYNIATVLDDVELMQPTIKNKISSQKKSPNNYRLVSPNRLKKH